MFLGLRSTLRTAFLALLVAAVLLLVACGGQTTNPPGIDPKDPPGIDPKELFGTIQSWQGGAADIEAHVYGPDFRVEVVASGRVDDQGNFELALPDSLRSRLLSPLPHELLQDCGNVSISQPQAQVAVVAGLEVSREGEIFGEVIQASSLDWYDRPPTGTAVVRLYVDEDVSIIGSCDIPFLGLTASLDMDLETGWNVVLIRVTESTTHSPWETELKVEVRTEPGPTTVGWQLLLPPAPPPPPPVGPDEFEPNDTPLEATSITLDFYYSLELTITPGDIDWFAFTLNEAAEFAAYLDTWTFEPVVSLFDSSLSEIAGSEWGSLHAELEAGTYYLAVSGYPDTGFAGNHEQEGFYYLYVEAWAPPPPVEPDKLEPNDSPEEATSITLDFDSPKLTVTPGDVDWFALSLTEAATVIADIEAEMLGSSLNSVMELFDAGLKRIAYNNDFCDEYDDEYGYYCTLDPRLEVDLEPGSYYLAVRSYDDYWAQGFYYLSVTAAP